MRNYVALLEAVVEAAERFCAELQEDADGVPQEELRLLHAALDEVVAYGDPDHTDEP